MVYVSGPIMSYPGRNAHDVLHTGHLNSPNNNLALSLKTKTSHLVVLALSLNSSRWFILGAAKEDALGRVVRARHDNIELINVEIIN